MDTAGSTWNRAILTMTSDSLGTSPIHRAVYVLENLLGRSPSPPQGML